MKVFLIVSGLLILLAFLIIFVISYGLARFISLPKSDLESSKQYEKEHNVYRDFDEKEVEAYILKSFDEYELHTYFVKNEKVPDSKKFVIISHGYTSSHYGALKYLNKWMELGFHCVIYDNRYHGANKRDRKKCCTMGINEARDLITVIDDTYQRFGQDIYLGLQGESMGSGLQITALKYKPKVHFIVNDCGFADLRSVIEGCLHNWYHLPKWMAYPASAVCYLFFGWYCLEDRPMDSLKDNTVPICFVHGTADELVSVENSKIMAKMNPAYSELHLFEGVRHAYCMFTDEDKYMKILKDFTKKVYEMENGLNEGN